MGKYFEKADLFSMQAENVQWIKRVQIHTYKPNDFLFSILGQFGRYNRIFEIVYMLV